MQHQPITVISAYRNLNPAEKQFVDSYVTSVETAAMRTGEPISLALNRPIPPEIVEVSGDYLLRPLVLAAINERVMQIASDTELTTRRIVKEWMNIAFSNMNDYLEIDPQTGAPVYDLSSCTPDQMAAVKAVKHKVTAIGSQEFEFVTHDKIKALDALSRMFGLLQDDNAYVQDIRRQQKDVKRLIDKRENAAEAYTAFLGA